MDCGCSGPVNETTSTIKVEGMTCSHCAGTVQTTLESVPGVKSVTVDLEGGKADVTYAGDSDTVVKMVEAINAAGYKATPRGNGSPS